MATRVRSHAKINLGLGIGAPRPDGFHGLATLYQTLAVYDWVEVSAKAAGATEIRVTSNDVRVPADARNTAWKMVAMALERLGITAAVEIHIEKNLPIQGGMGAGSANAVAALIGLERELGINENSQPGWGAVRLEIAAQVGSDVPLFLIGGTVLGLDRGQQVYPMPDLQEADGPPWCVVALPSVGVSTPQAFCDWDAWCRQSGLTLADSEGRLSMLSRVYASSLAGGGVWDGSSGVSSASSSAVRSEGCKQAGDLAGPQVSALVRTGIANDFERVVFLQHSLLSEIKRTLAAAGTPEAALHASLSGSGSALFGLYRSQGDAEAACARLRAMDEENLQVLLTRTITRSEYWQQMLQP